MKKLKLRNKFDNLGSFTGFLNLAIVYGFVSY